jgi:hypothetical protein
MCQWQLDSLPNLLLLHIQSTDVGVRDIWLFVLAEHGNGRVCLWRQNIDKGIGMTVQGDGGGWLELLAVKCGKDANDIIRASR